MSKPYALSPSEKAFAEELVGSGRYASVEDVVAEGLRLLAEHERCAPRDRESLRRAWREGAEGEHRAAEEVFDRLAAKYRARAGDGDA